jgi:hypothetical protein
LSFIVPRPSVLKDIVYAVIDDYIDYKAQSYSEAVRRSPEYRDGALPSLLAASTENLPRVARYIKDYLVKKMERGADSERMMVLGVHIDKLRFRELESTPNASGIFWRNTASEYRAALDAKLVAFKDKYWWISIYLFEQNRISADDGRRAVRSTCCT